MDVATGTTTESGHLGPIALDDPRQAFLVASGQFDVFAVSRLADGSNGRRRHLFHAGPGSLLTGIEPRPESGLRLLAIGSLSSGLTPLPPGSSLAADQRDAWIRQLAAAALDAGGVWAERTLSPGTLNLDDGQRLFADPRQIFWIEVESGVVRFLDGVEIATGTPPIPVAERVFVVAQGPAVLRVSESGPATVDALAPYHRCVLAAIEARFARWVERDARLTQDHRADADDLLASSFRGLAGSPSDARAAMGTGSRRAPIAVALAAVAAALGLEGEFRRAIARGETSQTSTPEDLRALLDAASIPYRRVQLRDGWWRGEGDPLLSWFGAERTPVALLPGPLWRAVGRDVDVAIDIVTANDVAREAFALHRTMPPQPVNIRELLALGWRDMGKDSARAALAGIAAAIFGLFAPVTAAFLFDTIVPQGDRGMLAAVIVALLAAAIGAAVFEFTRSIALLRMGSRFEASVQPALIDRLLRLPARFFHTFSAGEAADRVLGVQAARQILTETTVAGLLGAVFSLASLAVIAGIDWRLALFALGLVLIAGGIDAGIARRQLSHERARLQQQGKLDGFVLQLVMGITKLRAAGAESRAMAQWARRFGDQREQFIAARRWAAIQETAAAVVPILATIAIYAMFFVVSQAGAPPSLGFSKPISTGEFVALSMAFAQLMAAGGAMAQSLTQAMTALPLLERSRPLLAATPETNPGAELPAALNGRIELREVSFRYTPDGPLVLDRLNFAIAPGDFVALVGPSGSGKSTIMRLLLGFERPDAGEIFYDNRLASRLDLAAVRRQIGVVLQNGRISSGSVLSNIIGSAALGLDDAWAAARLAGLDKDIADMPMGMHTALMDGGVMLSGGQRQRLLIARALAHRPRILLFDEATSALDNRAQRIVIDTIEKLSITRIVIAHRLSTIQGVGRIFVLERGRVVQSGTHDELVAAEGPFAELVQRQML